MTTVNYQVGAGDDDAYENQDDTNFTLTGAVDQSASTTIGARTISGHRFTSVTVPKGADIITATLQLFILGTANDDINVDIHGEDADNAVDFAADADTINRVRTTAAVAWVQDSLITVAAFRSSPELKTVIQEIVNRGSWVSGNAIMILCKGKSDVTKACITRGHEDAPSEAAKLDITYAVHRKRSYARALL